MVGGVHLENAFISQLEIRDIWLLEKESSSAVGFGIFEGSVSIRPSARGIYEACSLRSFHPRDSNDICNSRMVEPRRDNRSGEDCKTWVRLFEQSSFERGDDIYERRTTDTPSRIRCLILRKTHLFEDLGQCRLCLSPSLSSSSSSRTKSLLLYTPAPPSSATSVAMSATSSACAPMFQLPLGLLHSVPETIVASWQRRPAAPPLVVVLPPLARLVVLLLLAWKEHIKVAT